MQLVVAGEAEDVALRQLGQAAVLAPAPDGVGDLLLGIAVVDVEVLGRAALPAGLVGEPLRASAGDPFALVGSALFEVSNWHEGTMPSWSGRIVSAAP